MPIPTSLLSWSISSTTQLMTRAVFLWSYNWKMLTLNQHFCKIPTIWPKFFSIDQSIAETGLKLLWNCFETALKLLWNCSEIAKLTQQDIARWRHTFWLNVEYCSNYSPVPLIYKYSTSINKSNPKEFNNWF